MGGAHNQPLHSALAALVYSLRASDARTVIVDGKVIMQERQVRSLDKAAIIAQVERAWRAAPARAEATDLGV